MEWFEFYGWKENPFTPKSNPHVVGLHFTKKRLKDYVNNGDICFVTGPAGAGKSSLLKWAKENLKRDYIPVYLSAEETDDQTNLEEFLKRSTWDKIRKKEFVLLLDESQESSANLKKALKLNWDKNKIKSIIIAQIEELSNFPENFQHRVGSRVLKLEKLTKSNTIDMINNRINGENPISPEAIEEIAKRASQNPRKILEFTEKVCMEMSTKEKKTINLFDVKKILDKLNGEGGIEIRAEKKEKKIQDKKPVKKKKKLSPLERKIVKQLKDGDKTVKDMIDPLGSSEGSIGKQISKLTKKGIVEIVKDGRPKIYGLVENNE